MEALIDLGGTPILATLQNMMTHEREMVRIIVDVVGSVDAAMGYMLSGWGADEDVEFDKNAAIRYVQQILDSRPNPEDFLPQFLPGNKLVDDPRYISENNLPPRLFLPVTEGGYLALLLGPGGSWTAAWNFAQMAQDKGFDDAGRHLLHYLNNSGANLEVDVDKMISELPRFQQNILEYLGSGVGSLLDPNNPNSPQYIVPSENPNYTIYSIPLGWKYVGIGGEVVPHSLDDIYNFDNTLGITPSTIANLMEGIPAAEGVPQELYDWFLAMNKFNYHPRVSIVVDNTTGEAELSYQVVVSDRYAWYMNEGHNLQGQPDPLFATGPMDEFMAKLDMYGQAQNYLISGISTPATIQFNVNNYVERCSNGEEMCPEEKKERYYNFSG
jgi:hypothetical protein